MNAYTHTGKMLIGALHGVRASVKPPLPPLDPKKALARVIKRHKNPGTFQEERANAAIAAGRAAFWNMSDHNDASGTILLDMLNDGKTFAEALGRAYLLKPAVVKREALDRLIPLNSRAANDLSEAYDEFQTWRDAEELERRAR